MKPGLNTPEDNFQEAVPEKAQEVMLMKTTFFLKLVIFHKYVTHYI